MAGKTKQTQVLSLSQLSELLTAQGIEIEGLDQLQANDQEVLSQGDNTTVGNVLVSYEKNNILLLTIDLSRSYGATKKGNKGYATTAGYKTVTIKTGKGKEDIGINVTVASRTLKA